MDAVWETIGSWLASGGGWSLLVDLALPSIAILIPTYFAVKMGTDALEASKAAREQDAEQAQRERVGKGLDAAHSAINYLTEAAYQPDFREAARIRFLAARELGAIRHNLGPDNDAVWMWIVKEFEIVAGGLEKTMPNGLPVHMERIVHRSGRFSNALSDWQMGEIELDWFRTAPHLPLEQTPLLVGEAEREPGDEGR